MAALAVPENLIQFSPADTTHRAPRKKSRESVCAFATTGLLLLCWLMMMMVLSPFRLGRRANTMTLVVSYEFHKFPTTG